jgi:benzodiazapine receptor
MQQYVRVILSFAIVFGAVILATFFISPATSAWYASLHKSDLVPSTWVFALVWIIVCVLMAFALARVWNLKASKNRREWFWMFIIQLLLALLWAVLFFTFHSLFLPVLDVLVLWCAVVALGLESWELDEFTFWLLVPYVAWTTFALLLSVALWWLN